MANKRHYSAEPKGKAYSPLGHSERLGKEEYAGPHQRRALERMDAAMISEDHTAMANMPQQVIMKYYPKAHYSTYDMDDTIRGIDKQQQADSRTDERRNAYEDGQY